MATFAVLVSLAAVCAVYLRPTPVAVTIKERLEFVSERVDRASSMIVGAKICGLVSRNGRKYTESALRNGARLYENIAVYLNHANNPSQPRSYEDRIGCVTGRPAFRDGVGLVGNIALNPKHPMAESVLWDAENKTKGVGLSHNIAAISTRESNLTVIEEITKVLSVDIVSGPATADSFFENTSDGSDLADLIRRPADTMSVMASMVGLIVQKCCDDGLTGSEKLDKVIDYISWNNKRIESELEKDTDAQIEQDQSDMATALNAARAEILRIIDSDMSDDEKLDAIVAAVELLGVDAAEQELMSPLEQKIHRAMVAQNGSRASISRYGNGLTEADLEDAASGQWQPTTVEQYSRLGRRRRRRR